MKLKEKPKAAEASKILLVLASLVLVVAGMKASADFFVPVLLAFFIATVSFPIMSWLREHRVPRVFAVLITVIVDFAFLTGVVLLGVMLVGELQAKWETKYYDITKQRVTEVAEGTAALIDKWGLNGDENVEETSATGETEPTVAELDAVTKEVAIQPLASGEISNPVVTDQLGSSSADVSAVEDVTSSELVSTPDSYSKFGIERLTNEFLSYLSVEKVLKLGTDFLGRLMSLLGTSFIVLLLTVFMLSEARMFGRRFSAICQARGPNLQRMLSATKDIQRYLGIKTLVSLITGFLAGTLCWWLELEFPLLWGIMAFALNFIPAIGSVIAGIPPVLLSLLVFGDWKHAMMVALGYLVINGLLGNLLEPMLLGRRFGISTLVVVVSVIFWGWVWGPIGMLLAVPLTMLVKVAMDNSADFRWVAVAISKGDKGTSESDEEKIMKEAVEDANEAKRKKLEEQNA